MLAKQYTYWRKRLKKFNFAVFKDLPAREKRITVATIVTFVRIILAPLIVYFMISQQWGQAFFLFVIASITDLVDGTLARWCNAKTFLGACLDPVADKVLLLTCFFTLAFVQSPLFSIPLWFVLTVLIRELLLMTGVVLLLLLNGHINVAPTFLGKVTTVSQMVFIIWLFACYFFHWVPTKTYYTMLTGMLMLILLSFCQYTRIGYNAWLGIHS